MSNVLTQVMAASAVVCLTIVGSASYAAPGSSNGSGGWEPSADHQESVVIALKTDPVYGDPEAACVALQIGINLLRSMVPDSEDNLTSVTPADSVILFPTLGGVQLINPLNDLTASVCDTPAGQATGSLAGLLEVFVDSGGEVIACPLCADRRGITNPTRGTIGSGEDIHNLFLHADKVIDF